MSETTRSPEQFTPAEIITDAITSWVNSEITNSYDNKNAVLNDYNGYLKSLSLPYSDPQSPNAGKSRSHFNRLYEHTEKLLGKGDTSDELLAKQLFFSLMGLSGAYREQCFVLAHDQDSYMRLRYGKQPLGLDIGKQVTAHLIDRFGKMPQQLDLAQPVIDREQLIQDTHQTNNARDELMRSIYSQKPMKTMRRALLVKRLVDLRGQWTDLTADYILFAAQQHDGDLSQVAFLEPMTIALAKMVRPLSGEPPYFIPEKDKLAI